MKHVLYLYVLQCNFFLMLNIIHKSLMRLLDKPFKSRRCAGWMVGWLAVVIIVTVSAFIEGFI